MSKPVPGTLAHLTRMVRKLEALSDRPRISADDRAIIASIIRQEIFRRRLALSDQKRWKRLGIDIAQYEFPDWVKTSKKVE